MTGTYRSGNWRTGVGVGEELPSPPQPLKPRPADLEYINFDTSQSIATLHPISKTLIYKLHRYLYQSSEASWL